MKPFPQETIDLAEQFIDILGERFSYDGFTYDLSFGRSYIKVIEHSKSYNAVHAFIDKDGNLLKPASWSSPAKGVRVPADRLLEVAKTRADRFSSYLYK